MRVWLTIGVYVAASFFAATLVLAMTEETSPHDLPHPAFTAGQAVGYLAWANEFCPGHQSDILRLYFARIARSEPEYFFRGFGSGEVGATLFAEREGQAAMCRRIDAMYGIEGTHIRNLWAPTGGLRSNR
jgi:hypothetical protein